VTLEMALYAALLVLGLALRVAELDRVPITNGEAQAALAAWNAVLPGHTSATTAGSPLIFSLQVALFETLGRGEFAARLATALAGVAVIFVPLLFRDALGRTRTFLLCALLAGSPVLLIASRTSSGTVWAALFAGLSLWALRRYWQERQAVHAALAAVFAAAMALLADPAGLILGLTLFVAGAAATLLIRLDNPDAVDTLATDTPREIVSPFRQFPYRLALSAALLAVILVSTLFMFVPAGLSNVGELISAGAGGLTTRAPGTPPFYALLTSLFYEPFLWLLAAAGIGIAIRRGITARERFLVAWLAAGVVASLLYAGTTPAYALWLTLPLAALASRAVTEALSDDTRLLWDIPGWSRWALALATVALLAVLAVSLQSIGRSLMRQIPSDGLQFLSQIDPVGAILVIMVIMFFIVGFFLAASLWNGSTAARGGLLGIFLFGIATSLGSGWTAATVRADNPTEFWHLDATTQDAPLLRATLLEVAKRESRGIPNMPVYVVAPDNGLVAWLLRDFGDVTYLDSATEARGGEIVLLPTQSDGLPDLGGSYVGQAFVLRRGWDFDTLRPMNFPAWWLQRRMNADKPPTEAMTLWLRQDVYEGVEMTAAG